MTKVRDLHKKWMKDPEYRREYDALEEEFALILEVAKARQRAGLSQTELAKRMKTTQRTIARPESGRGPPPQTAPGASRPACRRPQSRERLRSRTTARFPSGR